MKLKKVAKVVALLAVTIPLTVLSARADFNDDFDSYSQNLQARIYGGRASGKLDNSEYNRLMSLWNQVEGVHSRFHGRNPSPQERNSLMASLTQLDRDLTNNLHDNQFSRFQYWDSSRSDWKSDWQSRMRNLLPMGSNSGNYNVEIDAYQRNLSDRINQGKASGLLSGREYNRLNDQLRQIDQAQRDYRSNGYNYWERNNLMSLLTNLDRDIVAQLRDNNMSRYQYWNQDTFSWNQPWWQSGWQGGGAVIPIADQGAYDDQIDAYEWNLRDRLQRGFASGRITQSELNRIQAQLDDFNRQQWQYRYRGSLNLGDRNRLMNTLVSIDRNLSRQLNDNESRFQYWNASNNSWSRNWWGNLSGNVASNNYDEEIEAYRENIRNRLSRGRSSGRLTPTEYNRLNTSYQSFENLFNRYRSRGINPWERSALMNMLSSLDRDVVAQLRDNDQSHYQNWNPNRQNWNQNQQWWRSSNNRNDHDRNDRFGTNDRDRNDRVGANWNDNNNNNSNWRDRNDANARQVAEKAARDAAAREAAEKAARDAAAANAAAAKAAADKAAADRAAAEQAARDAARNADNRGDNWRNDNNDGNRGRHNGWNRNRDNDNSGNNNSGNNNSNNGNKSNSWNNGRGNDNQASDQSINNDDQGRGRGRGRHRDNEDNN